MHLFRFFISRTKEMSDAHGSLDILHVFATVLCHGAIDDSTPVNIFNPGHTQCDSGKCGKAVLLEFLWKDINEGGGKEMQR